MRGHTDLAGAVRGFLDHVVRPRTECLTVNGGLVPRDPDFPRDTGSHPMHLHMIVAPVNIASSSGCACSTTSVPKVSI